MAESSFPSLNLDLCFDNIGQNGEISIIPPRCDGLTPFAVVERFQVWDGLVSTSIACLSSRLPQRPPSQRPPTVGPQPSVGYVAPPPPPSWACRGHSFCEPCTRRRRRSHACTCVVAHSPPRVPRWGPVPRRQAVWPAARLRQRDPASWREDVPPPPLPPPRFLARPHTKCGRIHHEGGGGSVRAV